MCVFGFEWGGEHTLTTQIRGAVAEMPNINALLREARELQAVGACIVAGVTRHRALLRVDHVFAAGGRRVGMGGNRGVVARHGCGTRGVSKGQTGQGG